MIYYWYSYWPTFGNQYRGFLEQRSLRLVTGNDPATEPITLAMARQHLRLDTYGSPEGHPDDDLLEQVYIPAARAICEMISGRAFAPQTFELGLPAFPCNYVAYGRTGVRLGIGPVRGVEYVEYTTDGVTYTPADPSTYIVDPYTDGGMIYPAYGVTWPTTYLGIPQSVRVRFSAGYDPEGASPYEFIMPANYRWAVYLALGHVYENRENSSAINLNEIPMGVRAQLEPASLVNGFA